jgi:starch phosphorylase
VESSALYDLLESDIVPLFYARGADGLPRAWIARMKKSMKVLSPAFSTNRLLWEYVESYYRPAAEYSARLTANGMERARALAAWRRLVSHGWKDVKVESVEARRAELHRVGEGYQVTAAVRLGGIDPRHVAVEIYYGPLDAQRRISDARSVPMTLDPAGGVPGLLRYSGVIPCERSGLQGYAVRVRPSHPDANSVLSTGLMTWW